MYFWSHCITKGQKNFSCNSKDGDVRHFRQSEKCCDDCSHFRQSEKLCDDCSHFWQSEKLWDDCSHFRQLKEHWMTKGMHIKHAAICKHTCGPHTGHCTRVRPSGQHTWPMRPSRDPQFDMPAKDSKHTWFRLVKTYPTGSWLNLNGN